MMNSISIRGRCVHDGGAMKCKNKIVAIADPHLDDVRFAGPNTRLIAEIRLRAFRSVLSWADIIGAGGVVVCGDMFGRVVVPPWIIDDVQSSLSNTGNFSVTVIDGNHDTDVLQAARSYIRHPRVIAAHGQRCIRRVHPDFCGGCIPYVPGLRSEATIQCLDETFGESVMDRALLFGHFSIVDSSQPRWIRDDSLAVSKEKLIRTCKRLGIDVVVVGHYHTWSVEIIDGVTLVTIGALNPTASDQVGPDFGNVAVIGWTEGGPVVDLYVDCVPGVRYVTAEQAEECSERGNLCLAVERAQVRETIPIDVDDAMGTSLRYWSDYSEKYSVTINKNISSDLAVLACVDAMIDSGKVKGPHVGLADEALSILCQQNPLSKSSGCIETLGLLGCVL